MKIVSIFVLLASTAWANSDQATFVSVQNAFWNATRVDMQAVSSVRALGGRCAQKVQKLSPSSTLSEPKYEVVGGAVVFDTVADPVLGSTLSLHTYIAKSPDTFLLGETISFLKDKVTEEFEFGPFRSSAEGDMVYTQIGGKGPEKERHDYTVRKAIQAEGDYWVVRHNYQFGARLVERYCYVWYPTAE